jgi:ADP-glucose pyrophosphorylase
MINGTVVNSVLSPGVRVDVGAVVRDSIVMFDCVIRSGAVVDRSILDKEVVVGQGAIVGDGPDFDTPNRQEPGRLNTGITVVGKRAIIPRGTRIGRNVKVAGGVRATDFKSRVVKNGASVEPGGAKPHRAKKAAANEAEDRQPARAEAAGGRTNGARGGHSVGIPIAGQGARMTAKPRSEH